MRFEFYLLGHEIVVGAVAESLHQLVTSTGDNTQLQGLLGYVYLKKKEVRVWRGFRVWSILTTHPHTIPLDRHECMDSDTCDCKQHHMSKVRHAITRHSI